MDILNGKCAICSERTFVLSGKDKQKFVELLKEYYFDVNQINDNKFLLQFKEKRSEESICISCAYIIECYVDLRKNYCENKPKFTRSCSICRSTKNLTTGTAGIVEDASSLLKNVGKSKKIPRLNFICLDCSFCIISWNKIKEIISNYSQTGKALNGIKKRRRSVEYETESENESVSTSVENIPMRRTTRSKSLDINKSPTINDKKNKNVISPRSKRACANKKLKLDKKDEINSSLKHLSNVKRKISFNEICLTKKTLHKVTADDRLMFDIAYITCNANNLEKKNTSSQRKSVQSESEITPVAATKKILRSKRNRRKSTNVHENENDEDIILISDTENDVTPSKKYKKIETPVRVSLRKNKGKNIKLHVEQQQKKTVRRAISKLETNREQKTIQEKTIQKNKCDTCEKHYTRKYKLKLHELEHEASFKPVVVVQKENFSNSSSETKKRDNKEEEDHVGEENIPTLTEEVVDSLTQLEKTKEGENKIHEGKSKNITKDKSPKEKKGTAGNDKEIDVGDEDEETDRSSEETNQISTCEKEFKELEKVIEELREELKEKSTCGRDIGKIKKAEKSNEESNEKSKSGSDTTCNSENQGSKVDSAELEEKSDAADNEAETSQGTVETDSHNEIGNNKEQANVKVNEKILEDDDNEAENEKGQTNLEENDHSKEGIQKENDCNEDEINTKIGEKRNEQNEKYKNRVEDDSNKNEVSIIEINESSNEDHDQDDSPNIAIKENGKKDGYRAKILMEDFANADEAQLNKSESLISLSTDDFQSDVHSQNNNSKDDDHTDVEKNVEAFKNTNQTDEDSDMEPLFITPGSIESSKMKINSESDKYEIVESLLHNLGA